MDKFRLIEEVRKRPILWNSVLRKRPMRLIAESWEEVADILGDNVTPESCRSIWTNLRKVYRDFYYDVKNLRRNRIEMEKRYGSYDPKKNYDCKWVYYGHMHFLKEVFQQQDANLVDNENSFAYSEKSIDNNDYDEEEPLNSSKRKIRNQNAAASSSINKCDKQYPQFLNTEIEDEFYTTDYEEESKKPTNRPRLIYKNSEETSCCNKKSFKNQLNNAKEASNVLIWQKDYSELRSRPSLQDINDSDHYFLLSFSGHLKSMSPLKNLHFRTKISELILSILTTSLLGEKRQENTIQAESLVNVGDLDSNFLISFWPYMKLMTQLQNLQARSKISALMLNILSTDGN